MATSDLAYCWGFGGSGQLGDGSTQQARLTPRAVSGSRRFDHVQAGGLHTCGVTLAGRGFCWGEGMDGQIGNNSDADRLTPTPLAVGLTLEGVSAGAKQTCGVTVDHRGFCWGENLLGQLGDATSDDRDIPVLVAPPI